MGSSLNYFVNLFCVAKEWVGNEHILSEQNFVATNMFLGVEWLGIGSLQPE